MNKSSMYWKDDQLSVNIKLLAMFSAPMTVWIGGLIYFCQKNELSLFGREPLPINNTAVLFVILWAYILSAIIAAVIPRFTIWVERMVLPLTAIATLLLLFPFPGNIAVMIFYGVVFAAHFSIIMFASISSHLFTVETAWKSAVLSIAAGGFLFAVLRNDLYYIGFSLFTFIAAILIITATGFLYIIPGKIRVPFTTWSDRFKIPVIAYFGIFALIGLSSMLCVFAVSFASKAYHGLTFFFTASAFFSIITLFAWVVLNSIAIKAFILFFILIILGIVLASFSVSNMDYYLVACVLLGLTVSVACTWTFLLSTAFSMHPTRFIGIFGALIKIGAIAIGAFICDLFAENINVLCGIFAVVAVLLMLTYIMLHKYFLYAFESHTLGTNIRLVGQPFSLPHRVQTSRDPHPFDNLSDTELMMVKLLLEGHVMLSIAFNMSIDMETAKEYKKNIYKTLGIHSKLALFRMVHEQLYEF